MQHYCPELSNMLLEGKITNELTKSATTHLKYCPICVDKDNALFKEPYWHRIHQVVGVDICPYHKCYLESTSVPAYDFKNRHVKPISLNQYLCHIEPKKPHMIDDENNKHDLFLFNIAIDIMWILKAHLSSFDYDIFTKKIRVLLLENGFMFGRGNVLNISGLTSKFIEHYSPNILESFFVSSNTNTILNFFKRLLSRHYIKPVLYPVRILLLLRFLGSSAQSFFNSDKTYISNDHFGSGPWPCLNKASDHYKINTIFNIEEYWSHTVKDYFGFFKCPRCGLTYKYKSSTPETISIISYGSEWENKFRMLLNCNTPKSKMAKEMGISTSTIYNKINSNHKGKLNIQNINKEEIRKHYRQLWLEYRKKYPDATRSELLNLNGPLYRWLEHNDRDWHNDHKPARKTNNKINFELRDLQLKEDAEKVVQNILDSPGRPIRLTMNSVLSRITKEIWTKYPLTMQYLKSVVETTDTFYKRRIQWAIQVYIKNKIYPTKTEIRSLIVLQKRYASHAIETELEIARSEIYNALFYKTNSL